MAPLFGSSWRRQPGTSTEARIPVAGDGEKLLLHIHSLVSNTEATTETFSQLVSGKGDPPATAKVLSDQKPPRLEDSEMKRPTFTSASPATGRSTPTNTRGYVVGVPEVTLMSSRGSRQARAVLEAQASFTDVAFTTNTIISTSQKTITSDGNVFTSPVKFTNTRVLSTRVPVPTANISYSNTPPNTRVIIAAATACSALAIIALAVLAWLLLRRCRRRRELRARLSAPPFASPVRPLTPEPPSPPPPRFRLRASRTSLPPSLPLPSFGGTVAGGGEPLISPEVALLYSPARKKSVREGAASTEREERGVWGAQGGGGGIGVVVNG